MVTVRSARSIAAACASAVAILIIAGCSSENAGTPDAPTTLSETANTTPTTLGDQGVKGVSGTSVQPDSSDRSSSVHDPVQTIVASVVNPPSPQPSPAPASDTAGAPPTTTAAPASSAPTSSIDIVTVRITAYDPAAAELTYVLQVRNHPTDMAPYYSNDPADSAPRQASVLKDAPIRFVFSSCSAPYGELSEGGIACTTSDLAAAVARSSFLAKLDIVDGSIATITQMFQS